MPIHDHDVTLTPTRSGKTGWRLVINGKPVAQGTEKTAGQARQAAAAALLAYRRREFAGAVLAGAK